MRRATPPEWWRGEKPSDYAFGARPLPGDTYITGTARSIDFASSPPSRTSGLHALIFDLAFVEHAEIPLDWRHLTSMWSEFTDCTFTQSQTGLDYSGKAAQGSFGNRATVYRNCRFVGIRFGGLGRFSFGKARFENCVFEGCRLGASTRHAEFVECTFDGADPTVDR